MLTSTFVPDGISLCIEVQKNLSSLESIVSLHNNQVFKKTVRLNIKFN